MIIDKLIKQLQTLRALHGDFEVFMIDNQSGNKIPIAGLAVGYDNKNNPSEYMICDRDTMDSFYEDEPQPTKKEV